MSAAYSFAHWERVGVRVLNQGGTTEASFVLVDERGFLICNEQGAMNKAVAFIAH
jgi:hypothetical protein